MKRFIKYTGILILTVLLLGSCEKWIDPEINIDPDNPAEVSLATLMPSIQARMAFNAVGGNDLVRTQAIWMQQLDGVIRQSLAEANYQLRSSDVNNLWNSNYAGTMMDIKTLIDQANASDPVALHFSGAGKILMAIALMQTTDVWGDIPYSEAFQGKENISPGFESQQQIYTTIMTLLQEGVDALGQTDESPTPLDGDFLYGGNTEMWIKAGYAYMAKAALHLSKVNPGTAYSDAMGYLENAIQSADEDMQFNYGSANTEANPLYQFMRDRGDVRMGEYFVEMLKARQDPRLPVFVTPDGNGEYTGSAAGSGNADASEPGPAIAGATAPTYFATYMEMLLIKAECQYETGVDEATVKETLLMALEESLNKYGVFNQDYVDGYEQQWLSTLSGEDLKKEIITQKYISLCYQSEVYNDFRRTDNIMDILPNPNGFENDFPRRFPYSTDELTYNSNVPSGVTIMDRVWWDQ